MPGKKGKKTEEGIREAKSEAFAAAPIKRSDTEHLDSTKLRYVVTILFA